MTLFLNTVAARLSAILHKASDREWHAEREGDMGKERDEIVRKCAGWFETWGVCLQVCAYMCVCVQVCVMEVAWRDDMQSL